MSKLTITVANPAAFMAAIKGARDMLRESAKLHRSRGDGAGHGSMCDRHAATLDALMPD